MITKRQLGFGFIVLGLLITATTLAIDWLGAGEFQGLGPLQRITLAGSTLIVMVGLSLLPLGDRPA